MLTRLRPEPLLHVVPAFRGLLNRTYSARDTMITTSLILFTFTRRANLRGTAFKINQLHLATMATLANFSVDKLTRISEKIVIDLHVSRSRSSLQSVLTYKISTKDFGSSPGCAYTHVFWNKELHSNEVDLPITVRTVALRLLPVLCLHAKP